MQLLMNDHVAGYKNSLSDPMSYTDDGKLKDLLALLCKAQEQLDDKLLLGAFHLGRMINVRSWEYYVTAVDYNDRQRGIIILESI